MSTAAPIKTVVVSSARPLPLVIFFEGDELAKRTLSGLQKYRRISFEVSESAPQEVEHIVVLTREAQMCEQYDALRKPNVRVLALADTRFKDHRFDGAVYAYLPA